MGMVIKMKRINKTVVAGQTLYGNISAKIGKMLAEENEPYPQTTQYSLSNIEDMLKNKEITKQNAEEILRRLYEIGAESPERNRETFQIKRAVRRIKRI